MRVRVSMALGVALVDLEDGELELLDDSEPPSRGTEDVGLPLVVAAARSGSRVIAVVERRPPLVLSDDGGETWREAGGGLPAGVDVDIDPDDPDAIVFASTSRLYRSGNGGVFWQALDLELVDITAIALEQDSARH